MKSKSPDLTELQCCVIYERGYQGSCIDKTQKLTWGKKRRRTELTNVKRNLNDVQLKFWWGRAQKIKRARFSVTKQKRATWTLRFRTSQFHTSRLQAASFRVCYCTSASGYLRTTRTPCVLVCRCRGHSCGAGMHVKCKKCIFFIALCAIAIMHLH